MSRNDYRILPEAFDFVEKIVPLVTYHNGERVVLGEAKLTPDGEGLKIESKITDEQYAQIIAASEPDLAGFAIYNYPVTKLEGK